MSVTLIAMSPSGDGVFVRRGDALTRIMHGSTPGTGPVDAFAVEDAIARGGYLRIGKEFGSMKALDVAVEEIVRAHAGPPVPAPPLTVASVRRFLPRLLELASSSNPEDHAAALQRAVRYLGVDGVRDDDALFSRLLSVARDSAESNEASKATVADESASPTNAVHARWAEIQAAA